MYFVSQTLKPGYGPGSLPYYFCTLVITQTNVLTNLFGDDS